MSVASIQICFEKLKFSEWILPIGQRSYDRTSSASRRLQGLRRACQAGRVEGSGREQAEGRCASSSLYLSIPFRYANSRLIAHFISSSSQIVQKLLVSAKGEEVRFLVRTLVQNLRVRFSLLLLPTSLLSPSFRETDLLLLPPRIQIGAVRLTLTTALARAFTLTRPPLSNGLDHYADAFYLPKSARIGTTSSSEVVVGKGKGKSKQSAQEVQVRERWKVMCEEAEKLIRRVYVRHPNVSANSGLFSIHHWRSSTPE